MIIIDIARRRGVDINKITSQDIINNIQEFAVELGAPYRALLATIPRFELGLQESKSCVLPLHHTAPFAEFILPPIRLSG